MMRFTLALVVLLAACAKPSPVPAAENTAPTARLQSPITVTWEQLELTTSKARVMLHIKRLAPMGVPLEVKVEVPSMARMTIGKTSFELSPNAAADERLEAIELTYGQLPVQDLVVHVKGVGQGSGVSHALPYRSGRVGPQVAVPTADGPSQVINGKDLGKTISLDPKHE